MPRLVQVTYATPSPTSPRPGRHSDTSPRWTSLRACAEWSLSRYSRPVWPQLGFDIRNGLALQHQSAPDFPGPEPHSLGVSRSHCHVDPVRRRYLEQVAEASM